MWQLFGTLRNGESLKHDFHPDRLTIGRASTNSVQLEDETVSSLHAEIELVGPGRYILRDLGSKNGTFVDGVAITESEISNPCKIGFGALTFEIRIGGETEAAEYSEGKDGPSPEVAALRADCEKLRCELDSERKDFSKKIADITREHDERLMKGQKECEALGETIEELKGSHSVQLENEQRESSRKIAHIEKQGKARFLEKRKECEELGRAIEELKGAHGAELENQRREHSEKIADLEKQSEGRLLERQKECEGLNRTIEELKEAHGAELEKERREHAEKIADLEKQSEGRLLERQKECEELNRTIGELKGALSEKAEASRKAGVDEPSGKVAEEKTGSPEAMLSAAESAKGSSEKRPADCSLAEKSSKSQHTPGAVTPRFSRAMLANRRMGQWLQMLLWAGILGFGLMCLLAQSLPTTVLPSMNPMRIVARSEGAIVSSSTEEWETPATGAVPQGDAPNSGASKEIADKEFHVSPSDDPNEAAQAGPHVAARGSGEISMDLSFNRRQPPAFVAGAKKAITAGIAENLVNTKPGEAAKKAPLEQPSDKMTPIDSAEKGAASVDHRVQAQTEPCPCATGEPSRDDGLRKIAGRVESQTGGASVQDANSASPGPTDGAAPDQSAASPFKHGQEGASAIGFRLQEGDKAAPESANSGSDPKQADGNAPVAERTESDSNSAAKGNDGDAEKGSPDSRDQAKAEFPTSLSGALRHKDSLSGKILKGPQPLRVLILGDSLSLCGFGKRLDQEFRNDPEVQSVFTYMACGTHPLSWIKEKPYTTVKTHCGFWSIESSLGQPKELEDTYVMKPGYVPKPHPVPKLEDMLERIHPDILVMQCGTNLFSLFESRTTVQPGKDTLMVRNYIVPFLNAARKCSSLRKMYWVAPPTSGRAPIEIQDFVFNETRTCADWMATVIDSRPLVSYPYHHMEPDHEHFMGTDMTQWAERAYAFIKQDLSSRPFSSWPTLAQLQPPAGVEAPKKNEPDVSKEPLYVEARLEFKSQPIPLKELMPYQESLVGFVYDVSQVVNGNYTDKQILVLHPSCIGLKPQPLDRYKTGKMYKLRLHEVEASPWHTVKCQDESGRIDLIPYIQVEDEKKFPGTAR